MLAYPARSTHSRTTAGALAWCVIALAPLAAPAQPADDGLDVRYSTRTGRATFVRVPDTGDAAAKNAAQARRQGPADPARFILNHGRLFGVRDMNTELQEGNTRRDRLGRKRTTYRQMHNGVRVFAGEIRVHQNARGDVTAANGDFFDVPAKLSTQPALHQNQAEDAARQALGHDGAALESAELVVVDPGWYGDPPTGAKLAWHIILRDSPAAIREAFFIDARTGAVLDRWSMIHASRNRLIYDAEGGSSLPGTLARAEGWPADSNADVNTAYDIAGDTYDYFQRAFGRDSIDDEGMAIIVSVDVDDPVCPNAYWDGFQAVFCDGLVTDDVLAHELTHGITEYTANLIYQNQPGQLNESFSDVFGEMVDLFNGDAAWAGTPGGTPWPTHATGPGTDTPNNLRTACSFWPSYANGVRWLMGEDVNAPPFLVGAMRDMWNPTCAGDPDRGYSPYQTCPAGDSGGVHSGSGIPNHAFAIVVDGKTFNGQTVTGIGPIKAGAVWYRALSVYLTVASDFEDAYYAFNQAAQDLIGTYPNNPRTGLPSADVFTAFDAEQVDKALIAVEMNAEGACGAVADILNSTPPDLCAPRSMIFADDFENGVNGWTVLNTGPPTPYDWVLRSDELPYGHAGTVWFCDDPNLGDCYLQDESAVHSLVSPAIAIPPDPQDPAMSFHHYIATEGGWDGGNVKISVNGGAWQVIPSSAFTYNPYNASLNTASQGNTNPMASQEAWTSAGGGWGTSVVDLSGYVSGGESIRIRFDFGKDGCTGAIGWFVDDVELYTCSSIKGDFDGDGDVDQADFGHLQACMTGQVAQDDPDCQDARLDVDFDVDAADCAIFRKCMSGEGVAADPNCAN